MPQTIDLINFPCGEDVTHWPKLTCTEPGHLALQDAGLHLPDNRAIRFEDNGQIRSFDDTHRLVFDHAGGLLELHEAGAIRLLTGSPTPTERLRILATGQVGIGTATSTSLLHVTGDMRTDGALHVAGQAAVGGTLTVGSTVGIGTATPTQPLEVVGTVKATSFQGSGVELTGVRGTDATRVAKEGDTMSGPLVISAAGTGLRVTHNAAVGGLLTIGGHVGIGTNNPEQLVTLVSPQGTRLEITYTSETMLWSQLSAGTTPPYINPGSFVINQQSKDLPIPGADFALKRDGKNRVVLGDINTFISSQEGGEILFMVNLDEQSPKEAMRITGSGNVLQVNGDIRAGNSDIYFTKTDHNHTGIGNNSGLVPLPLTEVTSTTAQRVVGVHVRDARVAWVGSTEVAAHDTTIVRVHSSNDP